MAQAAPATSQSERGRRVSAFLSYAREDNRTRQDLCEALTRDGVDVHGDWTLVQGPKYWDQVVQLIRQADVFVALLSPAFTTSDISRREVDEAVSLGKRILPVVIEDVPDAGVLHTALQQPQWSFCRPSDPIDAQRALLAQAMRTDFDDLREHTDLLLAALRWEVNNKDRGLTLRGSALHRTGEWITRTDARPANWFPKPTTLQREYYAASLAAARRRKLIGVATTAALVVIGVIGLRRIQTEQADRVALANQQGSRQEAQSALALLPFKREEAAAHVQRALGLWRTPQAINAEQQLAVLRGALDVNFHIGGVSRVGFLRNGTIVALGNKSNPGSDREPAAVFVRCAGDSDVEQRYGAAYLLAGTEGAELRSLASSPMGSAIVAAGGRKVFAYSFSPPDRRECGDVVVNWTPNPQVMTHAAGVTAIAVNRDGTAMAFGDEDGTLTIAELPLIRIVNTIRYKYEYPVYTEDRSGKRISVAPADTKGSITALAFSEDGERIAVGTAVGPVAIWATRGVQRLGGVTTPNAIHAVALHPTLDVIAVASDSGVFIASTSITAGSVQQSLSVHTGPVRAMVFSPDGRYLVTGSDDQQVAVWDMVGIEDPHLVSEHPRDNDRLLMTLVGHTRSVNALAVAPAGVLFASGSDDGSVVLRSFEPLGTVQVDARKTLSELRAREEAARSKEPTPHPPTAQEIGVMIAIPGLDKEPSTRALDILSRHSLETIRGHRPDGGTTYTNTDWMPREKADQILQELKTAGIPAEIKTP